MEPSLKFIIGVVLICLNIPIGWGGLILSGVIAVKKKKRIYYLIGTLIYAFSWGILGLGVYLAGPEGLAYSKKLLNYLSFSTSWWLILIGIILFIAIIIIYSNLKPKKPVDNS